MRMRKQMILTIFVIAVAFGAETEFQIRIVLLGSSADRTLMLRDLRTRTRLAHLRMELTLSVYLLR